MVNPVLTCIQYAEQRVRNVVVCFKLIIDYQDELWPLFIPQAVVQAVVIRIAVHSQEAADSIF